MRDADVTVAPAHRCAGAAAGTDKYNWAAEA
jgi:hypothetical protein